MKIAILLTTVFSILTGIQLTRAQANAQVTEQSMLEKKPAVVHFMRDNSVASVATFDYSTVVVDIIKNGMLVVRSNKDGGYVNYPADDAGQPEMRFIGNPSVTTKWGGTLDIVATTNDNRIVRLSQASNNSWRIYVLCEEAGVANIKCKESPSITVFRQRMLMENIMSVFAITLEGKLIQFRFSSYNTKWEISYPAQMAGKSNERFLRNVVQTQNAEKVQDVVVITTGNKLMHLWNDENTSNWHAEFPAEIAGLRSERFKDVCPAILKHRNGDGQTIVAITADSKMVVLTYIADGGWRYVYPADAAGKSGLRFSGSPVFVTNVERSILQLFIFCLTENKELVQLFSFTGRWEVDYPLILGGQPNIRFRQSPGICSMGNTKKTIVCVTSDNKYLRVYDSNRWNIDFPF